ncbi:hypothetical protein [Noviherbaspirillum sedimenti]|uniref:hypothetical protein n=1 Tax=Noviherbaspirillum sedimenti TaxID=2320865 RepID=UPI00131473C4|nr:hypothetical protein [Noviherbaspirillum sedimenti]
MMNAEINTGVRYALSGLNAGAAQAKAVGIETMERLSGGTVNRKQGRIRSVLNGPC